VPLAAAGDPGTAAGAVRAGPLYVYGFVRAGAAVAVGGEGVGGERVTLVEAGDVAAVVSAAEDAELRLNRRDLQRHLRVIESVFEATTILPCPFGTVVESRSELEEGVLASARAQLLAGLTHLAGTVQMNVKAVYEEEELLRGIVEADPEVAALRERTRRAGDAGYHERLRLGELVAARIAERTDLDGERLLAALAGDAVDVAVEQPGAGAALKASFLVERDALGRFDARLEAIARDEQPLLRFEAIGPLPPTAFAAAYAGT
jgi:Gas vesicle synthesis protein GvpL/GvpF